MIAQSNVTHMIVGKDLNMPANTVKRADLATGQIGVFKVGSQTATGVNALSAGDRFTIATKNSLGVIVETPVIEYSNIKNKSAVDYAAATQRTRVIGYNGTSGTLTVKNSANYVMHVFYKDNSKTFGYGTPVKFSAYASSAAATQAEIAAGLVNNFNKNAQRETPKLMSAEVLLSDAGVATSAGVLSVTNGSKYVKIVESASAEADAGKYDTDGSTIAVGDFLRIGTAVTSPCYKVVAVGGTTAAALITLDTPYQGTTNASVAANAAEVIAAASAATANAGVKLTALPLTADFQPGVIRYDVLDFEVELSDEFAGTPQSSATAPFVGSGTYWEVAQNEWFLKGNRGEAWRVGNYPKNIVLEATSGKTYDQISFSYKTTNATTIDREVASFGTILIATEDASAGNIYASLKTVLGIS
jgi:hypothetical protein